MAYRRDPEEVSNHCALDISVSVAQGGWRWGHPKDFLFETKVAMGDGDIISSEVVESRKVESRKV